MEPAAAELTIDELATQSGTTARNIRAYQARGLLPAPEIRARTGYYGPDHLTRLRIIRSMQAEGFRLEAIRRLLDQPGSAAERIASFGETLRDAFGEPAPEHATTADLEARFGGSLDTRAIRKAERLGLIRSLGDGRWEVRNPTLVAAGEQLAELGVPMTHALAVAEQVDRHTRAIAKAYARLFLSDVMQTHTDTASTADWDRLTDAFERLRPLAVDAIRASFEQAMGEVVETEVKRFLTHS